jgi:hypothetical protein
MTNRFDGSQSSDEEQEPRRDDAETNRPARRRGRFRQVLARVREFFTRGGNGREQGVEAPPQLPDYEQSRRAAAASNRDRLLADARAAKNRQREVYGRKYDEQTQASFNSVFGDGKRKDRQARLDRARQATDKAQFEYEQLRTEYYKARERGEVAAETLPPYQASSSSEPGSSRQVWQGEPESSRRARRRTSEESIRERHEKERHARDDPDRDGNPNPRDRNRDRNRDQGDYGL